MVALLLKKGAIADEVMEKKRCILRICVFLYLGSCSLATLFFLCHLLAFLFFDTPRLFVKIAKEWRLRIES